MFTKNLLRKFLHLEFYELSKIASVSSISNKHHLSYISLLSRGGSIVIANEAYEWTTEIGLSTTIHINISGDVYKSTDGEYAYIHTCIYVYIYCVCACVCAWVSICMYD